MTQRWKFAALLAFDALAFLFVALTLLVWCPLVFGQEVVQLNGQKYAVPYLPYFHFQIAGATPGQILAIDPFGYVYGAAAGTTGAAFPGTQGIVCNTSVSAARTCNAADLVSNLGGQPVFTPSFAGNLASSVLADYNFSQATGTSLTDISGANACSSAPCNGTLGGGSATSPTWSGTTGLQFIANSDGVTLPATLNSARTFAFAYYQNPISLVPQGTTYGNNYGPLVSATTGSAGINLLNFAPCSTNNAGQYAPTIWGGAGCVTQSSNFGAGFHVKVFTLGTGSGVNDHIYVDGVEVPYTVQGASAGTQTSGNLFLGTTNTGPWAGQGEAITMYRARIYSSQLSAADVKTLTQVFVQDVQNRGIQTAAAPLNYAVPFLHCIGDSQTQGLGVTTPFCSELSLTNQPTYTIDNWGIGGIKLQAIAASDLYRVSPYCATNQGSPSVANLLAGVNDLSGNVLTPSAAAALNWKNIAGEIQTLKRAGCLVFVSTLMSHFGTDGAGNQNDADIAALNSLIRSGAVAAGAAGITDINANPNLGATGAAVNAGNTYWQSGGLHTTQAGTDLEAAAISCAMNYYFGTTPGSPQLVSAATYTMACGDRYVKLAPAAAQTITLPSCIGATGAVYTVSNPQSAFTVTLKTAIAAQTLNGVNNATTGITLPTGNTVLTVEALPMATSGCAWTK